MREAFEKAILDNPNEITHYSAFADWLVEQDDPTPRSADRTGSSIGAEWGRTRGEFMQVQLALEDESRTPTERKELQKREAELLKKHEREWLGPLAAFIFDENRDVAPLDSPYTGTTHRWRRGMLHCLTVERLSTPLAHAIADAPAARLLYELHLRDTFEGYYGEDQESPTRRRVPTPPGVHSHYDYFELIGTACLNNLRIFRLEENDYPDADGWCDCHLYTPGIEHLLASLGRVEELHLLCKGYESDRVFRLSNLTHLRVLRMYHLGGRSWDDVRYEYALDVLAVNPAFANLTHLQFHPHWAEGRDEFRNDRSYIPLDQVRALVRSPHLKSLTHLQLRLSDMGDEGVHEIIASGILKRLKWLDLRHGCITDAGAQLFAACPETKNLERLDLSRNGVTASGLRVLRDAGVNAVANRPLTDAELSSREYLREGDFE